MNNEIIQEEFVKECFAKLKQLMAENREVLERLKNDDYKSENFFQKPLDKSSKM